MSEHFIKNIEIKNFKCFDNFKAEGFGRVNLIGGKNNVGKTAFMEAVYVNTYSNSIETLYSSIAMNNFVRERLEYIDKQITLEDIKTFLEKTKFYSSLSNIQLCEFKVLNKDGEKLYNFLINNTRKSINVNNFSYDFTFRDDIEFLYSQGLSNVKLKRLYESVQRQDKEETLYQYINHFDKNILNFKIIGGDNPQCKTHTGKYKDLNEFGEGLKHWISIISALYSCEKKYLFIDEIDNGIHYTQLDKLWEIILTISKEQNVQVFATTHSKECIESYARVAKRLEETDIKFLSLYRSKNNELKSITFDYEKIQDRIELGLDNR